MSTLTRTYCDGCGAEVGEIGALYMGRATCSKLADHGNFIARERDYHACSLRCLQPAMAAALSALMVSFNNG